MFKKISDKIHEFVGSWAYFVGSVMADGYIDRMVEFNEDVDEEMDKAEEEANKLPNLKVN